MTFGKNKIIMRPERNTLGQHALRTLAALAIFIVNCAFGGAAGLVIFCQLLGDFPGS